MTQVLTLLTGAFREGNLLPLGKTPTAVEQSEALDAYNRLMLGVFGIEMGEPLSDWLAPYPQRTAAVKANYPQLPVQFETLPPGPFNPVPYPPKNSRIVFGGVTYTVYFPESPDDGSRMGVVQGSGAGDSGAPGAVLTLNGNGRTIETTNTVTLTDPVTAREWFYRADLGDWKRVAAQAPTDDGLFPSAVDDFWICSLAVRLAPRFSKPVSQETVAALKVAAAQFKARYRQSADTVYGSDQMPPSDQSFQTGGSSTYVWDGLSSG